MGIIRIAALWVVALSIAACGESHGPGDGAMDAAMDAATDTASAADSAGDTRLVVAVLTVDPALHRYGDVGVGDASPDVPFTVTNVGAATSGSLEATISGDYGFEITSSDCADAVLGPSDTCSIFVRFAPVDLGSSDAQLNVTDGDRSATAELSGSGVTVGGPSISPTPFDFGATSVGVTSLPQTFAVTNLGDVSTGEVSMTLTGTNASQFVLSADSCSGRTIGRGATCTVDVTHSPSSPGAHAAILQAAFSPGGILSATLFGSASRGGGINLVPGTQDFGMVARGTSSAVADFTLTNTGGLTTPPLTHGFGGVDAAEFEVTASACFGATLAASASCTISVRFNAGPMGAKFATLDVTGGASSVSSSLTAMSVESKSWLGLLPTAHDFGAVAVGGASAPLTFRVTNVGLAPLGPLIVTIVGTHSSDFSVDALSDTCTGVSLATSFCTVDVHFSPSASGARGATLRVAAPSGGPSAALVGSGTAP